ncbi:hypothetical protein Droror1_Dr00006508 [Drosera rotundifolia]
MESGGSGSIGSGDGARVPDLVQGRQPGNEGVSMPDLVQQYQQQQLLQPPQVVHGGGGVGDVDVLGLFGSMRGLEVRAAEAKENALLKAVAASSAVELASGAFDLVAKKETR